MKRGIFITFEGIDGSGKTVVMKSVISLLKKQFPNEEIIATREPGGSGISEKIRNIILDKNSKAMNEITELFLYTASRIEHVELLIKPSLLNGKIVICDRYVHSSLAYQGYGRKLTYKVVSDLNKIAVKNIMPEVIIFLELDTQTALQRKKHRDNGDRLDRESNEFTNNVRMGYDEVIKREKEKFIIIDATESLESVINNAFKKLEEYISRRRNEE